MPTITKHAPGFYSLDRLHCTGYRDKDGRILVGPASLVFAFRRPTDMEGHNIDPVDILNILVDYLDGHPASGHLEDAAAMLDDPMLDGAQPAIDYAAPAEG